MKRTVTFLILLLIIYTVAFGQGQEVQKKLTGTVLSSTGDPLAGASLFLKKNGLGAVTDVDGGFRINVRRWPDTLFISHIGYEPKILSLQAGTETPLEIRLSPSSNRLSAVTVSTGYQQLPKARVTGSFEQVDNQILNQQVSTDILSRLEGVSSILFDKNTNRPPLTVRGLSSINGPTDPLIIVDNFPYEGDIRNINPNDVESVTILKDAAAASIWGTRAGNGVIVIATKKGRFNQPFKMELNTNVTVFQEPDLFYLQQMSTSDFIDVEKFLFSKGYYKSRESNSYSRPPLTPVVETLIAVRDGRISDKEADKRINAWRNRDVRRDFEKYIYQPAVRQQYALNMSGGSERAHYFLSGGYDRNRDNLDARYNRLSFRSENTIRPFGGLTLHAGVSYIQSDAYSGRPSYQGFTTLYPYAMLKDEEGNSLPLARYRQSYVDTAGAGKLLDWNYYPLEDYKHDKTHDNIQDLITHLDLNYKILKGLSIDLKYQYERQVSQNDHMYNQESFYARDLINKFSIINWNAGKVTYNVPKGSILDRDHEALQAQNGRVQVNYTGAWGEHGLTFIAGGEIREIKTRDNSYRIYGYDEDLLTVSGVDYVNPYPNYLNHRNGYIPDNTYEGETDNHFVSTYANAAYTFDKRYTFSASVRRDASNLFGVSTNDKWEPLWSTGIAWNVSNEQFYKIPFLRYLKMRCTYGYSGNVDQRKSAVTTIKYSSRPAQYSNFTSAFVYQFGNPSLRWENVNIFNVGLDFSIQERILKGSIEYYLKRGTNLLGPAELDLTTGLGVTSLTRNVANIKGRGVEITLNSYLLDRNFKWFAGALFNYNKMLVDRYYMGGSSVRQYASSGGSTITPMEGKPLYSILSYKWMGLDNDGNPTGVADQKPSNDYRSIINSSTEISDLVYGGPAIPTIYGSLINVFSYKAISVSFDFLYKLGYNFRKESINYATLGEGVIGHSDFSKRWQKPGDEKLTSVPSMVYPIDNYRSEFYNNSEIMVRKADNIRLNYIRFSYKINKSVWRKLPFNVLQLYFNASNLGIIWKANKDGIDPDYERNNELIPPKEFSIGLSVSL